MTSLQISRLNEIHPTNAGVSNSQRHIEFSLEVLELSEQKLLNNCGTWSSKSSGQSHGRTQGHGCSPRAKDTAQVQGKCSTSLVLCLDQNTLVERKTLHHGTTQLLIPQTDCQNWPGHLCKILLLVSQLP